MRISDWSSDVCSSDLIAVIEEADGPPLEDRLGEDVGGHVGPPPRPVDSEEAQPGARQPVEVGIALGHQLVGPLGRRIERDRAVDPLVDRERQLLVDRKSNTSELQYLMRISYAVFCLKK